MPLRTGRYTLGPDDGTLLVMTGREGAAARMGHDLTLLATRWSAAVSVNAEDPARSRVTATIDAGSLVVRDASGGPVGLSESQRGEVEEIIRTKVLLSERYPRIAFRSVAVEGTPRQASVAGNLTIRRRTRPVTLSVSVRGRGAARLTATTSIVQTSFGIEPYSALLGALRVKDVVDLAVEVRLPLR